MAATLSPHVIGKEPDEDEVEPWRTRQGHGDAVQSDGSYAGVSGQPSRLGRQVSHATHYAVEACSQKRCFEVFGILFPWLMAMLIGVLTALTGTYISVNCDFLSDFRFGYCRGLHFADRNRCCGGSDNLDVLHDRCITPRHVAYGGESITTEWVPWEEIIGVRAKTSLAGHLLTFLCYMLPSAVWSGLAVFLVSEYCPAARGSGIPEVKAAVSGFDLPNHLSGWCLLVKTVGLSLVVGAGLSLGKEGPLIQIGACWACLLKHHIVKPLDVLGLPGEPLPLHALACVGSAAGVSTAFGAPLGGVLFAAEELGSMRELSRRTLLLAFLAAFTASFVQKHFNLYGANRLTLFNLSVPSDDAKKEWVSRELPAFLLIGVIAGLVGAFFIRLNLGIAKERRLAVARGRLWFLPDRFQICLLGWWVGREGDVPKASRCSLNVVEGILIAIVTALLNYPFTALLRNQSTEAIYALFETCPHKRAHHFGLCDRAQDMRPNVRHSMSASMLLAAAIRILQTSFTFGSCMPSGLFIPSLFIGASIGRFVGVIILTINEYYEVDKHIDPGVFAMVGAVAMLSGFCRMTVSLVVIMLELTGHLTYVVPFMCACLVAKLVGDALSPSVYDAHAQFNGYPPVEELHAMRLDILLVDLVKELELSHIFDLNEHVPLQRLVDASKEAEVVVVMRTDEFARCGTTAADRIVGVVEQARLERWLKQLPQELRSQDDVCSFSPTAAVEEDCCIAQLRVSGDWQKEALDASDLVDGNIARLSAHAPLLTAQCVFEQKPSLRYCICVEERDGASTFSLLSRQAVQDALTDGHFPLQREAIKSDRSVGAAAAFLACQHVWRRDRTEDGAHNGWRAADGNEAERAPSVVFGASTVDEEDMEVGRTETAGNEAEFFEEASDKAQGSGDNAELGPAI
mmetsp:Transcript_119674/g.211506  ORF Transcript_119674/g.211506 Transcript_119674/m.211506 type:complete len:912 (+) Transcript_119674:183-2918(+)